tara:strand:- start:614 stop:1483 length:870 start_codon:yes stop_codon:yes gene_type:complete
MKNQKNRYNIDLLDIVRGYSVLNCSYGQFYFKHHPLMRVLELDHLEQIDIENSKKRGIKSEQQLIDHAIKIGSWSLKKEESLKSLVWTLKKSQVALGKIEDVKQRAMFNDSIKSQERDIKDLKTQRQSITSYSAEHLAQVKKIKRLGSSALFCDLDFKKAPPEDYNVVLTTSLFERYAELNNRDTIIRASYFGGFFDLFLTQEGSSMDLIGANFLNITTFQKLLLTTSNSLLKKMQNTQIPDELYDDPVKILNYEEKEKKDSKVSHGVDDLKAKSKARGGKLKAEDFLS